MRKIFDIAKKELSGYFKSPIAYIVMVLTITIFNIFFFMMIDGNKEATLHDIFRVMEFMFVFLIPILTMKIFSEEKMNGTMEFLMTTPTRLSQIIAGKFLGSFFFYLLIILMTTIYYGILEFYGSPDRTAVLTGYFGILLEGAFFIAVGMLTSSWTKNQIISAISSYSIIFLVYFSVSFTKYFTGLLELIVRKISVIEHSGNLFVGLLNLSDIVYFITGILFCLLLTKVCIDAQTQ